MCDKFNKKSSLFLALTLMFSLTFLSGPAAAEEDPEVAMAGKTTVSETMDYSIGPEDVLEISVWKNEELSKTVLVRPDGNISLPLIGEVRAAGRAPREVQDEIVTRLGKYQETAVASVIVKEVNSCRVFILGDVMKPGSYQLRQNTTLLQAVALAGGFNEFASENNIVLIRQTNDGKGGVEKQDIRFDDLVYSDTSSILLKPGDTIFVP